MKNLIISIAILFLARSVVSVRLEAKERLKEKLSMIRGRLDLVHNELRDLKSILINDMSFIQMMTNKNNPSNNLIEKPKNEKSIEAEKEVKEVFNLQDILANKEVVKPTKVENHENQEKKKESESIKQAVNVSQSQNEIKEQLKTENQMNTTIPKNEENSKSINSVSENRIITPPTIVKNINTVSSNQNNQSQLQLIKQESNEINSTFSLVSPSTEVKVEEKKEMNSTAFNTVRMMAKANKDKKLTSYQSAESNAPKADKIVGSIQGNESIKNQEVHENKPELEKPIHQETELALAAKLLEPPKDSKYQNAMNVKDETHWTRPKFKEPIIDIMSQPLFTSNDRESKDANKIIRGGLDPFVMRFSVKTELKKVEDK